MTSTALHDALIRLAREDGGSVIALLARRFGDLDLADDAVQDALLEAAEVWPERGIPDNPAGWLYSVARNRGIDRIRRETSAHRRVLEAAPELLAEPAPYDDEPLVSDSGLVGDERLRLLLLCCHPALDPDSQVALTLRLVGGLTTPEIASAFLTPVATLAQRLVRAKRKIRDAGIPLSIPPDLDQRLEAVLGVLYLIFNEGYLSSGADERVVRVDLAHESIRLAALVDDLVPGNAEVEGLLALELFHLARAATRTDEGGDLVLLDTQDRTLWDLPMIERANALLRRAIDRRTPGPYQVQAMIAGCHANARTAEDTDWPAIVSLYQQLLALRPSPVVALNSAVAIAMADGPHAGLAALDAVDGLARYHLFHAARGELLVRVGDRAGAHAAFTVAYTIAENPAERRHLERRTAETRAEGPSENGRSGVAEPQADGSGADVAPADGGVDGA